MYSLPYEKFAEVVNDRMKILSLNAYFQPELIAFSHLENDLLTAFSEEEFEIVVITPIPTRGIDEETRKKYAKIKKETLYNGLVIVNRFWAPKEGRNPVFRALRYFWCNLREYQIAKKQKDIDIILVSSTPPTQGWIAGRLKRHIVKHGNSKVKLLYNLQDIFPDSAINAGIFNKDSLLWKIGRHIENVTYRNADKIIVISKKCERNLIEKKVPIHKIHLISNWIDISTVKHIDREDNKLIGELGLEQCIYIVVYAGNMGETQGVEVILKAAKILESQKEIQFVLFGGGSRFKDIECEAQKCSNIKIFPLLNQNRVSEVYSLGDVALITCRAGTGAAGLPSKLWSIMACETPIIASFDIDSDLNMVLMDSKCGKCVSPNDENALADAIKDAYEHKDNAWMKNNARLYVNNHASKEECVRKYIDLIKQLGSC